jgi:hypothetical protein
MGKALGKAGNNFGALYMWTDIQQVSPFAPSCHFVLVVRTVSGKDGNF